MFKILKILSLSVILVLSFYSLPTAVEKPKIDSIVSYAKNIEAGKYNNFEVYKVINTTINGSKIETTLLWSKENTAEHDYFDWKWTLHVLKVHHYITYDVDELEVISRDYQDFSTVKSRGFIEWVLIDGDLDGKIDLAVRDYFILSCEDDDCIDNHFIMPYYPEGFINKDWYNLSEKESNKKYDKEINYWMKTIWGTEK